MYNRVLKTRVYETILHEQVDRFAMAPCGKILILLARLSTMISNAASNHGNKPTTPAENASNILEQSSETVMAWTP